MARRQSPLLMLSAVVIFLFVAGLMYLNQRMAKEVDNQVQKSQPVAAVPVKPGKPQRKTISRESRIPPQIAQYEDEFSEPHKSEEPAEEKSSSSKKIHYEMPPDDVIFLQ